MPITTIGDCPVFGCVEPRPLVGFPDGKVKIKMTFDDWVRVFILTDDGIRSFLVKQFENPEDRELYWKPFCEIEKNHRP